MKDRVDLAILGFDARGSGVVLNALRIARAAARRGLKVEIWLADVSGNFAAMLPEGVHVRHYGAGPAKLGRTAKLAMSLPSLARTIGSVRPRILMSAGNHMHLAAAVAFKVAGSPADVKLLLRASNATWRRTLEASLGRSLGGSAGEMIDYVNSLPYRAASGTVSVSTELRDHLERDLRLRRETLSAVATGVDLERVSSLAAEPLSHPWLDGSTEPLIVAVGRLSRQKNFESLVSALAILRKTKPARLAIIGENIGRSADRLHRHAARLGVSEALLLTGFDSNPYRWMKNARLVAVTSRYEGSSNVVLEALAVGVPVVAFRCPTGIAEVLEPVLPQNVLPQGDIVGLAGRMSEILSGNIGTQLSPPPLISHGQSAEGYLAVFERMLSGPSAKG